MIHALGGIERGVIKMWSYRIYGGGGGLVVVPPEAGKLTGIVISQKPYRVNYIEGDSLEIAGLKVIATSENNIDVDVTEGCTVYINEILTTDDDIVTVKYQDFETTFNITVNARPPEIPENTKLLMHFNNNIINEITGVNGTNNAGNISYKTGKFGTGASNIGDVSSTDMPTWSQVSKGTASATYEFWMKFTGTITTGSLNWLGFGTSQYRFVVLKSTSITVYGVANETSYVDVNIPDLNSHEWIHMAFVFDYGTLRVYINGEKKAEELTVGSTVSSKALYFSSDSNVVIDEVLMSTSALYTDNFTPNKSEYGGKAVLSRIYLETPPTKTTYQVGETLSLEGAVIKAEFSTGAAANVTNDCVIENNVPLTLNDDFRSISYTYEGVEKRIYINVGAYGVTPLEPEELSLTPSAEQQIIEGTVYDKVVIQGDTELVPSNIRSGANIFGVAGSYKPVALSNVVPESALILTHLDGVNVNEITGDSTNLPALTGSYSTNSKFGTNSARAGGITISNFTGIPTYTELVNGQAELTVSFWGYLQNTTGKLIFSARHSTYNNQCITIQQNNKTRLSVQGTIVEIGSNLVNQWHHYGIAIKDGYLNVFFDGSQIYNGKLSGSGTIPLRISFGESDTAVLLVDEILVCNEAIYTDNFIPLDEPYVLPPKELNVTPSTEDQVLEGLYNKVTVTGDIDLLPENIKSGVEIFGVTGTLTAESGETEKPEQVHNYLMLYDGSLGEGGYYDGNGCYDITGGWELNANVSIDQGYSSGVANSCTNSLYLEVVNNGKTEQSTFTTAKTINIEGCKKIAIIANTDFVDFTVTTWNALYLGDIKNCTDVNEQTESIWIGIPVDWVGVNIHSVDLVETTIKDFYLQGYISASHNGGSAKCAIYGLFMVKEDDYQPLLDLAGIENIYDNEEALCSDDVAINSILENEEAVKYMIYNCTGTFMLAFIQSKMALKSLNYSPYKTMFYGNEVWLKFLMMMSQELKNGMD